MLLLFSFWCVCLNRKIWKLLLTIAQIQKKRMRYRNREQWNKMKKKISGYINGGFWIWLSLNDKNRFCYIIKFWNFLLFLSQCGCVCVFQWHLGPVFHFDYHYYLQNLIIMIKITTIYGEENKIWISSTRKIIIIKFNNNGNGRLK